MKNKNNTMQESMSESDCNTDISQIAAEEPPGGDSDEETEDLITSVEEWEAQCQSWFRLLDDNEEDDPQVIENLVEDDDYTRKIVNQKYKLCDLFDISTLEPILDL